MRLISSRARYAFLFTLVTMVMFVRVIQGHDVVVATDVSGSMAKILRFAQEGGKLAVVLQPDSTTVHVASFSDTATQTSFRLRDRRAEALLSIDSLRANGGTNYLALLQRHVDWPDESVVTWLSDGAHNGDADDVLRFVTEKLVPKGIVLCTVSIGTAAGSEAESLLSGMAAVTGGSYTRVESSEDLVTTLVDLAGNAASYRHCTPQQDELTFSASSGCRVLAFAYDGEVEVGFSDGEQPADIGVHGARLPGEKVQVKWVTLTENRTVRIRLVNPQTTHARLGAVYRSDLARARLDVDTAHGRVMVGTPFRVHVSSTDPDGRPLDARGRMDSTIEVSDSSGRVVQTIVAEPALDRPVLQAEVELQNEGVHTLRALSRIRHDGVVWNATDEASVIGTKPKTLSATPAMLRTSVEIGEFNLPLKLRLDGRNPSTASWAARLKREQKGLELVSTNADIDGVQLRFEATKAGRHRGSLVVVHNDEFAVPLQVPYDFEILPPYRGLADSRRRKVHLGAVTSDSDTLSFKIGVKGLDSKPVKYRVQVRDLTSGGAVLPTDAPRDVVVSAGNASSLSVSVKVGAVAPAEYTGRISLSPEEFPEDNWEIALALTVSSPISARKVNFGVVSAGGFADAKLLLRNRSPSRISLDIEPPVSFESPGKQDVRGIEVLTTRKAVTLESGAEAEVTLAMAVPATCRTRGPLSGQVTLRRRNGPTVRVPVTLDVTDPGRAAVEFIVVPERLRLTGDASSIKSFTLRVRPTEALKRAVQLEALTGRFVSASGESEQVTIEIARGSDTELRPGNKSTDLAGTLLMPLRSATGEIVLRGANSSRVVVPVELSVR